MSRNALRRPLVTLAEAAEGGLSRSRLRGRGWQRVAPGVYAPRSIASDPLTKIAAALERLPRDVEAAASFATAAYLHGLDLPPCDPIHITVPERARISGRAGVAFHKMSLEYGDIVPTAEVRATSPLRTLADLGRQRSLLDAVVALDMGLHEGLAGRDELAAWAAAHRGFPGVGRLREAIDLSESLTESPRETQLRLILVQGGLPRPVAQVSLYDVAGGFLGRADLYYPEHRLVIEYDGGTHRFSLVEDDRRQNLLVAAGYTVLRFTVADLANPQAIVARVGAMLGRRFPGNGRVLRE